MCNVADGRHMMKLCLHIVGTMRLLCNVADEIVVCNVADSGHTMRLVQYCRWWTR